MKEIESIAQTLAEYCSPSLYQENDLESKEQFQSRKAHEFASLLETFKKNYQDARIAFIENDPSGAAKLVLDKINSYVEQQVEFFDKLTVEDYNTLFDIAMKSYDKEDIDTASIMLSTVVALFPQYIQPYIMLANITWVQQGIETAIGIYQQLLTTTEDPLLYSCAANCFVNSEDPVIKDKARTLFQKALDLIHSDETKYADYAYLVEGIKSQLSTL